MRIREDTMTRRIEIQSDNGNGELGEDDAHYFADEYLTLRGEVGWLFVDAERVNYDRVAVHYER